MTSETITRALRKQPFDPITIDLADGRSFTIRHPEMVAHGGGRTLIVFTGPEQVEEIDLLLAVSLTRAESSASQSEA